MPRYVILRHEFPPQASRLTHWDLMMEHEGRLLTWSLPTLPIETGSLTCTKLPDHRIHYLDYEGDLSDNRGKVKRVETGEFEWLREPREGAWQAKLKSSDETKIIELTPVANSTTEWLATLIFE